MKYDVINIDSEISRVKLKFMGITIHVLTPAQKKYPASRQEET